MYNKNHLSLTLFIFLAFLLVQCNNKEKSSSKLSQPEFNPDIAAFTSGLISSESYIRIRLASDFPGETETDKALSKNLFVLSPSVDGKTYWVDNRTLEFRPDQDLVSGTEYKVKFRLSELYPQKDKTSDFNFSFNTIPINISIDFTGIKSYSNTDLSMNRIEGSVRTSDKISISEIESLVTARQNKNNLELTWDHQTDKLIHNFSIDSVRRTEAREIVEVLWEGEFDGKKIKGLREYEVPSLGSFILMENKVVQLPQQYIVLRFSDPIKSTQSLDGLISLSNNTDLKFSIEDNEIRVYPSVKQYGKLDLKVEPGIQNILGYKYQSSDVLSLNFEEMKPAVRLVGNGVILPNSGELLFPFEAVNLKAVDVKVIKIFEDNIGQFLQINSLEDGNELKRAGRLLLKKTINLIPERPVNFGEWNAFSLDLNQLIKSEPGAIYRIELSIRKKHSLYSCPGSTDESGELTEQNEFEGITDQDIAYWDAGGYYYDDDYEYYNWDERDDPCTDSYYSYYGRKVARNVLASNLGIIAKAGTDNSMLFVVTDLRTTEPQSGVKLSIYNYQQQLLASLTTDNEGLAKITLENQPYLLIASKAEQRAYLRLDQQSALSLSQFDISGAQTQKGVKGYIYGERGVWRPGDTIHLTFILEDEEDIIPDNHPVVFELYDPLGKLRKKITRTSGLNGFYQFSIHTNPDDITGNWNAGIKIGGINFNKSLKVETVKPNRLKISLDFGEEMIYSSSGEIKAKLSVKWLHGAIAKNLMSRVDVNYTGRNTDFPKYKEFTFTDITKIFDPVEKIVFDGNVNESGEAEFTPDLNLEDKTPGMVNAVFTTRTFEQGGDFSINRTSIPYSPYPVYIGMKAPVGDKFGMLLTDTLQIFQIQSLNETGKPVSRKNLDVKVYKLDWSWWWHSSSENLASYAGKSGHKAVFNEIISTDLSGKGTFKLNIKYPEWGRFLVLIKDPDGGHSCSKIVYFDWPGWAGRATRKDPQAASILPFSSDKSKYNVGETAKITIPSGEGGRILLCIENGTKVIDHYWLNTVKGETSFSFTLTEEMAPNVYVSVSFIQAHAQTKNDLPLRMYGVIPILVEDSNTHLYPQIDIPSVLRPETEVDVKVKEKNGREMTYTLAIVDEGLLDLTNFNTPDPWNHFYVREALGVRTFDLYDLVIGAYGGRIDGVFSLGGDGTEVDPGAKKSANRFPPMVKFLGPFNLKKGTENIHKISIPNYVGSVRTMIIAGQESAYGNTEETRPVRKPLMVLTTLPRVLSPGETLSLPVTVFAMEDNIRDVQVSVETNDLFELKETSRNLTFTSTGEMTIDFDLKVKEKLGIGNVKVKVKSGNEEAWHSVELDVRSPNPVVTEFIYSVIDQGESWQKEFSLPGMAGTNEGILEVSSVPPVDFGRRLKFLLRYPHGCIEQTVSAAFPQLFMGDIMEVDENFVKHTDDNIKAAITRIGTFIQPSGGFGYWPSSTTENDWGSSYTGHFLLEAKEKGFQIPESWINNWIKYQSRTARNWNGTKYQSLWHKSELALLQAYRLYTLALAGKPEMGAMNRLRELPNLNPVAKWRLAAAYTLAGQSDLARQMVNSVTTKVEDYVSSPYTYGSPVRDKALILETMSLLKMKEEAVPVLLNISEELSSTRWHSTQTVGYSLLAVSKYLGSGNTSKEISFQYNFGNDKSTNAATKHPVAQIPANYANKTADKILVKNNGTGKLFVRLSVSGIPLAGYEQAKTLNLGMDVKYRTMDGKPLDVSKLEQGTDFICIVSVHNPGSLGYYNDMALSQIFPSGWEIQNMRLFESGIGKFNTPAYQDIRDDRIYSYFDISQSKRLEFAIKLTATYKGRFYLPGISCDAMYRSDINAVVPGKWIEVVAPGGLN